MKRKLSYAELPAVVDTDPNIVAGVGELLAATVDFSLPGFGIVYGGRAKEKIAATHNRHGQLILRAASMISPPLVTREDVLPILPRETFRGASEIHSDGRGCYPRTNTPPIEQLRMDVRLQTADPRNGADVYLATAAPGLGAWPGDAKLFKGKKASEETHRRGYDGQDPALSPTLIAYAEGGEYDPLVMEGRMYHFDQQPLSSVVFVSDSFMGPPTLHGFVPHNLQANRSPLGSCISVYTQPL